MKEIDIAEVKKATRWLGRRQVEMLEALAERKIMSARGVLWAATHSRRSCPQLTLTSSLAGLRWRGLVEFAPGSVGENGRRR